MLLLRIHLTSQSTFPYRVHVCYSHDLLEIKDIVFLPLDEVKYVTLTSESLRSCAVFSFPEFLLTNNQADNIRATVVSGNGRVDLGRSISEVIPQIDEGK